MTEPLLLLSPAGQLVTSNPPSKRLLGGASGPDALLDRVEDPEGLRRYLRLASRTGAPLPGSVRLLEDPTRWRADASAATLAGECLVVMQLRAAHETTQRFVTLNEQIEQLHAEIRRREQLQVERELLLQREREARSAAEDASRFKDELLASVSHELRTPLHAITGWLNLIRDDPDDRQRLERGLEVIERNVLAETQLTEDLVDASLVITGRMKVQLQRVDLERVIRDAVETVSPAAQAKQQRIQVVAAVGDCVVDGDPARLLQVVWNLLSNATKYTPKGGKIRVVLRNVKSNAEIEVTDSGEGIAPEVLPYVFDRFRRSDGSSTRRHGGLGLGLAIVRHLVELHGGVVFAESEGLGRGSTFTVNLPLPVFQRRRATTDEPGAPESPGPRPKLLEGVRVLLVEDNADARELLVNILGTEGASVHEADDAPSALAAFRDEEFDFVLSDIEMPGEDGFTLMRKLRDAERELGRRPALAVAISAHSIGDARLHALRAGFQSFIAKPMNPPELLATLHSLRQGWRSTTT